MLVKRVSGRHDQFNESTEGNGTDIFPVVAPWIPAPWIQSGPEGCLLQDGWLG